MTDSGILQQQNKITFLFKFSQGFHGMYTPTPPVAPKKKKAEGVKILEKNLLRRVRKFSVQRWGWRLVYYGVNFL